MQASKAFLEGKVAVVTGAGGGIGRDIALLLAQHGASVVVNDLGKNAGTGRPHAEAVVEEIKASGGNAVASIESVADWSAAQRIVQTAVDHFGKLDCVVNNAGILRDRFFFNMSEEEWRAVLDVHVQGSFFVARAAAPHFKAQESGSYIHMTSAAGLFGNMGQANYAAAKMAVVGLSKSIAIDMAKFNVRSNCVAPWAWTAMTASITADTPERQAHVARLKKMESHKIAPVVAFLASDRATDVSGQIFGVRANEIYFISQPRIVRSMQRSGGWTPEAIAEHVMPAFRADFYPNERAGSATPWDPI